jgi:hypothetical protein
MKSLKPRMTIKGVCIQLDCMYVLKNASFDAADRFSRDRLKRIALSGEMMSLDMA